MIKRNDELTWLEKNKIIAKKMLSSMYCVAFPFKRLFDNVGKKGIYIVVYHQILPESYPYPKPYTSISPKSFEEQISFFGENFKVVSLDEAHRLIIQKDELTSNYLSITFDDGYRDNFEYGFPILQKYRVPASIFVAVAPVDRTILFWPDVVRFVCYNTNKTISSSMRFGPHGEFLLNLEGEPRRIETIKRLLRFLKNFPEAHKRAALNELADYLEVDLSDMHRDMIMDWDLIRELAKSGLTIGSHTITHPILRNLDSDALRDEIIRSKIMIEEQVGTEVRHFAYPNGTKDDLTPEIVRTVKEAGYHTGLSTIRGINYPGADPFTLCRTGIYRSDSIQDIAFKLCMEKLLRLNFG